MLECVIDEYMAVEMSLMSLNFLVEVVWLEYVIVIGLESVVLLDSEEPDVIAREFDTIEGELSSGDHETLVEMFAVMFGTVSASIALVIYTVLFTSKCALSVEVIASKTDGDSDRASASETAAEPVALSLFEDVVSTSGAGAVGPSTAT